MKVDGAAPWPQPGSVAAGWWQPHPLPQPSHPSPSAGKGPLEPRLVSRAGTFLPLDRLGSGVALVLSGHLYLRGTSLGFRFGSTTYTKEHELRAPLHLSLEVGPTRCVRGLKSLLVIG
jgi:hypothetical protein